MSEELGRAGGPPGGDGEGTVLAPIGVGEDICVWNRYLERWTDGFAVAEVVADGYRLERRSDGHVFDDVFSFEEVRPERRRTQLPGIVGTPVDRRRQEPSGRPEGADGRTEPFLH